MTFRRWSPIAKAFALLAVASGGAAFLLVRGYAARLDALRPTVGEPVPVVVAARSLDRGQVLAPADLAVRQVPSAYAPVGALRSAERAGGRVLLAGLAQGEALTRTRLAGSDAGPVAALVPSGLRAFPIVAGMPAGIVRPGDLVDVLAAFGGQHPYTQTVAEGLEVARVVGSGGATGSGLGLTPSSPTGGPTLILLVDPAQSERLAFAVAFGTVAVTIAAPEPATAG